jgi:hypothetical protein
MAICIGGKNSHPRSAVRPPPGRSPRAQQPAMPVVGWLAGGSPDTTYERYRLNCAKD